MSLVINPSTSFDQGLQRLLATSKKSAAEVMRQQARLLFVEVAKVTPPFGSGALQKTGEAQKNARAKVAADIYGLYGLPNDAFDAIKDRNPGEAQAFWYLHKKGDTAGASDLLRAATGSILHPFDDGAHHRRNFRKKTKNFRFYVSDPANLKAYVRLMQDRVWWLASGWSEPLAALGARVPAGVNRHRAPGLLRVEITDQAIEITMRNDVRYAVKIDNLRNRIRYAMDRRADALNRRWEDWMKRLARESGLKVR